MKNKVNLSKFNNSWYNPGNSPKKILWYFINLIFFKSSFFWPQLIKLLFLKSFGAKLGKAIYIKPNINIKYPWFLEIGNNVWIGENVWIDNLAKVKIDDNVCISQGAMLLSGNHNYKKSSFDLIIESIHLKEGSWVGAKSVICPGVTVNSHAILSVNSVATNDLEAYSIYKGNPAVKIRDRIIES